MKPIEKLLPLADAAMCAVLLILLLADVIWPAANIFLNDFVKLVLPIACLLSSACGAMLAGRQRRQLRRNRRARRY